MYKSCFYILTVLALFTSVWADEPTTAPTTGPAGVSLLSNADFKTDDGSGKPAGWQIKDGVTWEAEGDVKFLRFVSPEPGKMVMVYRQLKLPTPLPPALEVHVKARSQDLKPGEKLWFDGRVILQFKNADGKIVKPQPPAPNFKGTTKGWVDKSVFFAVPEGATTLEIMPCLFNVASGTMDIAVLDVLTSTVDKLPPPPAMVPSQTLAPADRTNFPAELHVSGNQLLNPSGQPVWLQGLTIDSLQWSAGGDHVEKSIPVAIDQWHANVIRLAVKEDFWFGWGKWQQKDKDGFKYRAIVDNAIQLAASRGAYLVIDLHRFGAPDEKHAAFWKDVATRYKDHPAVIFELFNEPHDISWKVWRDGGNTADGKNEDVNVKESSEGPGEKSIGMQALVDAVRSTGATNLIVAGGIDWSYNISGMLKGYALTDHDGGHGIVYSTHVYPWKKNWQKNFLDVAEKYPLFMGEVGCPEKWEDFKFIPENERYETLGPGCTWPNDILATIQQHKINWTGFSFHPKCGPPVISDWDYTPTPYWGVYVKRALAGEKFELGKLR